MATGGALSAGLQMVGTTASTPGTVASGTGSGPGTGASSTPTSNDGGGSSLVSSFSGPRTISHHKRRRSWLKKSEFDNSMIWLYTFFAYALLTSCRQCLPVSKPFMLGTDEVVDGTTHVVGGFAPFNNIKMGSTYLGILDSCFVFTYTVCSFIWAHKAFAPLHMQIKILNLGLLGSALSAALFGIGGIAGVHQYEFYVFVQLLMGFMQSGAWSAVLNIYYAVFDVDEGIFIFSSWASCSAIGNIVGRTIASPLAARYGWPIGFFCIGGLVLLLGLTYPYISAVILSVSSRKEGMRQMQKQVHLEEERRKVEAERRRVLTEKLNNAVEMEKEKAAKPKSQRNPQRPVTKKVVPVLEDSKDAELASAQDDIMAGTNDNKATSRLNHDDEEVNDEVANVQESVAASSETNSMMILFIFLYSIGLMFSKWMNYLMSLWLPVYLNERVHMSEGSAGSWSSAFDIGAVFGMFFAFYCNYYYKKPGCLCFVMCAISIPVLLVYSMLVIYMPLLANAAMLLVAGMLFNGPYSLISTVVTMQLSVQFGANANAIISIVNGSGSAGSLCAGVFTAMISSAYGWNAVFYMLVGLAGVQLVPLGYISFTELFPSKKETLKTDGEQGPANRVKPSYSFSDNENEDMVLPSHVEADEDNSIGNIVPSGKENTSAHTVRPSPMQSFKIPQAMLFRNRGSSISSNGSNGQLSSNNVKYVELDSRWADRVEVALEDEVDNTGLHQNEYESSEGYMRLDGDTNAVRPFDDP
jgi:sugar phosphate permease